MAPVCDHCGKDGAGEDGAVAAMKQCSQCKSVRYCNQECQAAAWRTHKRVCKPHKNAQWATGLSPVAQHEWLCDCYRMRMDDAYAWGGGDLRGIMDPGATPGSVCKELLVFCKLAVKHRVVPAKWDWKAFLEKAAGLVVYAFEKSDAKDKYGEENVFAVVMQGGRSLRYTGEVVYGSPVMSYEGSSVDENTMHDAVEECGVFRGKHMEEEAAKSLCADIGGLALWLDFKQKLKRNPGPNLSRKY